MNFTPLKIGSMERAIVAEGRATMAPPSRNKRSRRLSIRFKIVSAAAR
jgi:hypothetical protein